jgi:hypothetical protein
MRGEKLRINGELVTVEVATAADSGVDLIGSEACSVGHR